MTFLFFVTFHLEIVKYVYIYYLVFSEEHSNKAPDTETKSEEHIQNEMNRIAALVDNSLKVYDENDDGYIYYGEFYRY